MDQEFTTALHPATWIRNAALSLAERKDVELHILMHDKRFARDYRFEEHGLHFHFFRAPIPRIPRPVALYQLDRWKFYRELREIRPDIVHGHGTENLFSYVAVTSGYPHVVSIQAIISRLLSQYRRLSRRALEHLIVQFVERYTVRRAQNFIIKAPFAEGFVRSLNPTAPVFLLENIVHEVYFEVDRRTAAKGRKIIFIGTLINTKGVEELIRSFNEVAPKHPDLELHLLGTGTEAYVDGVLKPLIKEVHGRVVLRGHVPSVEIAREFEDATMVVLPSYFETSPNVIAEAMVAGVPVIGTDVGGMPFMIAHDKTGQIVPVRDVPRLTAAIERNLKHPDIAEAHAAAGCSEARKRYGRQRYVDSLLGIYASILEHPAKHKRGNR
jgi:glycosyltransferase involved in cell wall biosynthesis